MVIRIYNTSYALIRPNCQFCSTFRIPAIFTLVSLVSNRNLSFLQLYQKYSRSDLLYLPQLPDSDVMTTYLGLFQKLSSKGSGNFFYFSIPRTCGKAQTPTPTPDKSEYQLPTPHLNILVPQDKLDVIMHPPSGQKNPVSTHP